MSHTSEACGSCEGRCCTAYIVPITGADVWRIVQGLRLAPAVFARREPEAYPTASGFQLRAGGPTYGLALQHHEVRRNERVCIFLMQLRERSQRCGIYPYRPRACQTYPMRYQNNQVTPREDLLCPTGSWAGLNTGQAYWRDRLQLQDAEWQQYEQVVAAWNIIINAQLPDSGCVLDQYLNYLICAYDLLANGPLNQASLAQVAREFAA